MDLPTRKLNLIAYLSQLQDELLIRDLEKYIVNREKEAYLHFKPFTDQELISRIEQSEADFEDGNFTSQEELEKISSNW